LEEEQQEFCKYLQDRGFPDLTQGRRSLRVRSIQVQGNMQDLSYHVPFSFPSVQMQALIDCRAQGNFLDGNFIKKQKIPIYPLNEEIEARNINGSQNKSSKIKTYARL
jgi:hypothetical protein